MTDPTSEPEATSAETNKPPAWRLGLMIVAGGAVMAMVGYRAMADGTSSAPLENGDRAPLEVGDCFELPDSGEFSNVTEQDCTGRHQAQVYGTVFEALGTAEAQCRDQLEPLLEGYELPPDAGLAEIAAEGETFSSLCVITSDAGALVGSLLP